MKQIQFSRAGKRRFNKRVNHLVALFMQEEKLFRREWHKLVRGWLGEARRRAKSRREGSPCCYVESAGGLTVPGGEQLFGLLKIANTLLAACGDEVEEAVGDETRLLLTNEYINTVTRLCDGRPNFLVDDRVYRRAKR